MVSHEKPKSRGGKAKEAVEVVPEGEQVVEVVPEEEEEVAAEVVPAEEEEVVEDVDVDDDDDEDEDLESFEEDMFDPMQQLTQLLVTEDGVPLVDVLQGIRESIDKQNKILFKLVSVIDAK